MDYQREKIDCKNKKINMKNLILILILNLTLSGCAQEKKCTDFKVGKFEYANPEFSEWKVTRTDSTQVEISSKSGIEIYGKIKWENDCEYSITYEKILNTEFKDMIGKTINAKIIKTYPDRYVCVSKNDSIELELEMVKVE
ncbi:hypothetical protein LRR18_16145 [Mangrovimonas sp. AS39]|uniref:hypothetical protein n=2 Tax=Mangrovimonas futianensis TaxID=2895523 RepID=UPI001E346435|nr:hypothetical protein [Mangrovimonas futianensis]MCF1193120.1 hypothetical protein [Mangrovimonas futianensis]